ncbi:MAG TPA: NUDIX domain-containing protein [Phycisphaerales bacterium]|nr:NUDIX domain-containing protein [Phycisphaerales bacterium]
MASPPLSQPIEFISRGLIIYGGHTLVCWSRKGNYGYLPGGHVETGEPAGEALAREMVEETGLTCRVGPLLLTHENRFTARKKAHHELNLVFAAEITDRAFRRALKQMCHVAHPETPTSGPRRRRIDTATPPPVTSREPHLEFRWLAAAAFKRADIRPGPMAKWVTKLQAAGLDSTDGMRAADAPTAEFLSSMSS